MFVYCITQPVWDHCRMPSAGILKACQCLPDVAAGDTDLWLCLNATEVSNVADLKLTIAMALQPLLTHQQKG